MKYLGCLVLLLCVFGCATGSGGVNAPDMRDRPYLILVSIDGFRWDYQDLVDTPALDEIAASGVRAESMLPVFPTLTFPNHYSIATGLYPANHKLIGNHFPNKERTRFYSLADRTAVQDGYWYGGQPIWVAAEKSGMVSAAYFFVGSEAPVDATPLTYWHDFDASIPGSERVRQTLQWLSMPSARRPHMITLYFEDVDTATHDYGPGSQQSFAAIEKVDGYLQELIDGIHALPISDQTYVVVVSDHGQTAFLTDAEPFIIDTVANLNDVIPIDHETSAFLYFKNPDKARAVSIRDAINGAWDHGRAMLPEDTPAAWQVNSEAGFADVIVQADPGYAVYTSEEHVRDDAVGGHGWPPESKDMHGIFLASGRRLPQGARIESIKNIDVYPLMMEILGLPITTPIDGDRQELVELLQ